MAGFGDEQGSTAAAGRLIRTTSYRPQSMTLLFSQQVALGENGGRVR